MSLLTPVIRRALRLTRASAIHRKDGARDIGGPLCIKHPKFPALSPHRGAVAQLYPRWVDKAAPGSA